MAKHCRWQARVTPGKAGCQMKAGFSTLEAIQAFACALCRNGIIFYINLGEDLLSLLNGPENNLTVVGLSFFFLLK